jgi:hypothetical protein
MKKNKKIIIATSGQPCGNPRMVKEAIALYKAKYEVTVLYCPLSPWGDDFDEQLFNENRGISWIQVGAHPYKSPTLYFFVRMRKKIWGIIYQMFGNVAHSAMKSSVLYSQELEKEVLIHQADLYVGHNLGSLKAILKAAKKHGAKASFDFEDYHRGEDVEGSVHWNKVKNIEDQYLPFLNHATAAAPLITVAYKGTYPHLKISTILNVFPCIELYSFVDSTANRLRLYWFSQTVGKGRGLESIIEAVAQVTPPPEITLLGNCTEQIKQYFISFALEKGFDKRLLHFKPVVSERELFFEASKHHIGICSEDPKTTNHQYCLANKIFTYMMAKNALILSNTKAQSLFLAENGGIGQVYPIPTLENIRKIIQMYQDDRSLLEKHRTNSLKSACSSMNWESESLKLTNHYEKILNN